MVENAIHQKISRAARDLKDAKKITERRSAASRLKELINNRSNRLSVILLTKTMQIKRKHKRLSYLTFGVIVSRSHNSHFLTFLSSVTLRTTLLAPCVSHVCNAKLGLI